jgi:hypothetical protein
VKSGRLFFARTSKLSRAAVKATLFSRRLKAARLKLGLTLSCFTDPFEVAGEVQFAWHRAENE